MWIRKSQSLFNIKVSRTWVNFQFWVNYDFKNNPSAPGTSLTWLRFKGRSVLSPELQGCRLEDLFGFM